MYRQTDVVIDNWEEDYKEKITKKNKNKFNELSR